MGDLITLNCPSCGGKLDVNSNTLVLSCKHCGSEHLVHRESGMVTLESFARCPKCGRNDRVEKVSAIHNYKTGSPLLISKLTPPSLSDYDNFHIKPIPTLKLPDKPKLKKAQEKPEQNKLLLVLYSLFLAVALGLIVAILINPTQEYKGAAIFFVLVIFTTIAIILKIPANLNEIIEIFKIRENYENYLEDLSDQNTIAMQNWEKEADKAKALHQKEMEEIREENQRIRELKVKSQQRYKHEMKRWENLYYCYRDDSVFFPGEGTYVTVDKMKDYLFENG